MARELPVVCSLGAGDLEQRLVEIGSIGSDALVGHEVQGGKHVLHFRSNPHIRRRLDEIVAAEAECCAFLDLDLSQRGDELLLSIGAPEAGQPTADALAGAFSASDR